MKFIHLFIAAMLMLAVLSLTGCAETKPPLALEGHAKNGNLIGFATLSDSSSPTDMAASAVYTKLALLRHITAKKLRAGDIDVDKAKDVQEFADSVRADLDKAVSAKNIQAIQELADLVATVSTSLD